MEKHIKTAAKLYECRDTAKRFFNEQYKEKLKPYIHVLKHLMKDKNLEEIPALLEISKTEHYKENAMDQMMYMAAVVELIEPSA
jgi:predicted house-cleaning noncanonical NTP pyrophosphatase (MazG superfamily)